MSTSGIKTKKIGEVTYVFNQLPASKALKLAPMVARIGDMLIAKAEGVSGAQFNALFATDEKGMSPEKAAEASAAKAAFIKTLTGILSELPGDDWTTPDGRKMLGTVSFIGKLMESVEVKGQPIDDIDVHFTGRIREMMEVAFTVMEHNFLGSAAGSR